MDSVDIFRTALNSQIKRLVAKIMLIGFEKKAVFKS